MIDIADLLLRAVALDIAILSSASACSLMITFASVVGFNAEPLRSELSPPARHLLGFLSDYKRQRGGMRCCASYLLTTCVIKMFIFPSCWVNVGLSALRCDVGATPAKRS